MKVCARCKEEKPVEDYRSSKSYCTPCFKAYRKEWRAINQDKVRESNAKYYYLGRYEASFEQKKTQLEKQDGKCALCANSLTILKSHWDHNHTTGQLREVLCRSCNMGIGLFKEDVGRLKAAIAYLDRHAQ